MEEPREDIEDYWVLIRRSLGWDNLLHGVESTPKEVEEIQVHPWLMFPEENIHKFVKSSWFREQTNEENNLEQSD